MKSHIDQVSPYPRGHSSIVLFYKYFLPHNIDCPNKILDFCTDVSIKLGLKGRILIAEEGINGTVSSHSRETLQIFIDAMESFELIFGHHNAPIHIFENIDWKISSSSKHSAILEPFPDLKISVVKEIISTGGQVLAEELKQGGRHLTPEEFHQCLNDNDDVVLIDVRNTFEHAIGHFINPLTQTAAVNPETVTFSSFDATFCASNADKLKNKKVLMYCTGGIRCEKASVMLKKRGVKDVAQLSGGIHRYLEKFGNTGLFVGKNFVFDQRVALSPSECGGPCGGKDEIVGRCIECTSLFDEICGSRVCTVCRDLVLVCTVCRTTLREYHCHRHQAWKHCYFTFLDVFSESELSGQKEVLLGIRETHLPASQHKNVRRTLSRQIDRIEKRIMQLRAGTVVAHSNCPRRCRTCSETNDVCDGKCWGFWKTQQVHGSCASRASNEKLKTISAGDLVGPGPNWNELRLGVKTQTDGLTLRGVVTEMKRWGSGGCELNCAVVLWKNDCRRNECAQIYRWGVVAMNGSRLYDLELCNDDRSQ